MSALWGPHNFPIHFSTFYFLHFSFRWHFHSFAFAWVEEHLRCWHTRDFPHCQWFEFKRRRSRTWSSFQMVYREMIVCAEERKSVFRSGSKKEGIRSTISIYQLYKRSMNEDQITWKVWKSLHTLVMVYLRITHADNRHNGNSYFFAVLLISVYSASLLSSRQCI